MWRLFTSIRSDTLQLCLNRLARILTFTSCGRTAGGTDDVGRNRTTSAAGALAIFFLAAMIGTG